MERMSGVKTIRRHVRPNLTRLEAESVMCLVVKASPIALNPKRRMAAERAAWKIMQEIRRLEGSA